MTRQNSKREFEKLGGIAAFVSAGAAGASLFVALVLIGMDALSDPQRLAELARVNPLPLLLQDALKILTAAAAFILVMVFRKTLRERAPTMARAAVVLGLLAIGLLLANALLSIFAVAQAANPSPNFSGGDALTAVIGLLGMGAIMANGIWYLLVNWAALKNSLLPRGLCYLGLVLGAASLIPFLALGVLVLGVAWAIWLGVVWRRAA